MMCHFTPAVFRILFGFWQSDFFRIVFGFWQSHFDMFWCWSFLVYSCWNLLSFFNVRFTKYGECLATIFSDILSAPFSLPSLSGIDYVYVRMIDYVPQVSFRLCSFFFLYFSPAPQTRSFQLTYLQVCWLFLLFAHIWY